MRALCVLEKAGAEDEGVVVEGGEAFFGEALGLGVEEGGGGGGGLGGAVDDACAGAGGSAGGSEDVVAVDAFELLCASRGSSCGSDCGVGWSACSSLAQRGDRRVE